MGTGGSPGTWEALSFPRERPERGDRYTKPQAGGQQARGPTGANRQRALGRYRRVKEDEARREGRQGVGALHSTEEVGEPNPKGTRWREGGASLRSFCEERWRAYQSLRSSQRDNRG